jgi:hypothetical protein
MPDYSKSKIYKITSPHTEEIYIGATTQKLAKRKASHICKFKEYKNGKYPYTTSFKLIELGEVHICLLEEFSCENKEQLYARERHHIEQNKCVNNDKSYRESKEYNERTKLYLDDKEKTWTPLQKNRKLELDRIRSKIKITCECGAIINKQHHLRHEKSPKHLNAMKP